MLKKLTFVCYFICICIAHFSAVAVNCPSTVADASECLGVVGCVYLELLDRCEPCTEGAYYDSSSKTCKSCPSEYPNSAAGSVNGKSDCYKPCETIPVTGGHRVPSSDKAYYNTQCTYTTQCNTTGATNCSNMGFHPDGDNCVPDVRECGGGNGFQFYANNGTFTQCYVSSCTNTNESLIPQGDYVCNGAPYGVCMTNAIPCNTTTPGLNASACSGTISGNATLNGGTYNLSQCACEKTSVSISNGNAGEKCFYNGTSNRFDIGCTYTVISCNDGYCSTDGQSCVTVPENKYKSGEKDCVQCPAGSYRSGSETKCYWNNQTLFTDKNGSFTIPASGKIIAK